MKDEQKRFGKGFAVALAVHLVLAAGLGIAYTSGNFGGFFGGRRWRR